MKNFSGALFTERERESERVRAHTGDNVCPHVCQQPNRSPDFS